MKLSTRRILTAAILASITSTTVFGYANEEQILQNAKSIFENNHRAIEPTRSLKFEMSDSFWHNRIFVVDGTGDPDAIRMHLYAQDLGTMLTHKIDRLNYPFSWASHKLVETKFLGFRGNIKWTTKFEGCRISIFSKILEKIFRQTKYFSGNVPVDIHRKYPIWDLHLRDRDDALAFVTDYVAGNIEKEYEQLAEDEIEQTLFAQENDYVTFAKKPLLLLSLEDDPDLETLTNEDYEFFSQYFELVKYNDIETTNIISKIKMNMDKNALKFDASKHAIELKLNWKKVLLGQLEKQFENFDTGDIAVAATKNMFKIGIGVAATLSIAAIIAPFKDDIKTTIKSAYEHSFGDNVMINIRKTLKIPTKADKE